MKPCCEAHAPGDDALRFLRVGRTQVRDLRRLKLCQLGFPAQDPKRRRDVNNTYLSIRRHTHNAFETPAREMGEMKMDSRLLPDSRCRIGGVELCKSLDVFKGFVIYSKRERGERGKEWEG